jgi:hypothetical protein
MIKAKSTRRSGERRRAAKAWRSSLSAALWLAAAFANTGLAAPSDYPSRPIRLLVPFAPGGGADTLGRILVPKLSESMGQQWVVDNRGGAAGNIAAETVARANPDGYTIFMGFSTVLTVNPSLYKLSFDMQKDLQPMTLLATAQYILVVHPSVPASTVKELVALAKQKPRSLNFASAGVGSPLHLAGELFQRRAGVEMVHIPYKGGGPAAAAVLGGEAQVLFGSVCVEPAARQIGQAQSACHDRAQALESRARTADDGRIGLSGIRCDDLVLANGSSRNAAGDREPHPRRRRQGDRTARRAAGDGGAGARSRIEHRAGPGSAHPIGVEDVGRPHQVCRHQSRVSFLFRGHTAACAFFRTATHAGT